jgi:hypothetical protein
VAELKPHPANVPGEFYVVDGCCTLCEVPFAEAPDLFGTVQDPKGYLHCFVKRQPETPAELDQMVSAIRCAELQCIRYRGSDRLIQLRLVSEGEGGICDGLPADLQAEAGRREAERQRRFQEYQQSQRAAGGQHPPRRPWWRFW